MLDLLDPDALIEYYERHLQGISDEETYDTEALLTLVARDKIKDRWPELSTPQRERVFSLDDRLATMHRRVADVLPHPSVTDRLRWWWFLHEGPKVRAKGRDAA